MSILSMISIALWTFLVVYGFLSPGSVKIHGSPTSPLMRVIVWLLFYPAVGVLFVILGYVGQFMVAPLVDVLTVLTKGGIAL